MDIQKRKKSKMIKIIAGIVIGIIIFFLMFAHMGAKAQQKEFGGINPNIQIKTQISQGGNYKYAITTYDAKDTSDQQIINFYNKKVIPLQGKEIYYCILEDGNESISFTSCSDSLLKGIYYKKNGAMPTAVLGEIKGDKIIWQK
ncbi:MAG: hypothetical protein ACRCWG_13550 [Sarcina sp.]